MKHAVFGPSKNGSSGDYYENLDYVTACLNTCHLTCLVLGGGKGVEALAEQYAANRAIDVDKVAPNFHSLFGSKIKNPNVGIGNLPVGLRQSIFAARNDEIITRSDRVIVFWDGEFFEIGQLIRRAVALKKPVTIFPV